MDGVNSFFLVMSRSSHSQMIVSAEQSRSHSRPLCLQFCTALFCSLVYSLGTAVSAQNKSVVVFGRNDNNNNNNTTTTNTNDNDNDNDNDDDNDDDDTSNY